MILSLEGLVALVWQVRAGRIHGIFPRSDFSEGQDQ